MKKITILLFSLFFVFTVYAAPKIVFKPNSVDFGSLTKDKPVQSVKVLLINSDSILYLVNSYKFLPNEMDFLSSDLPATFSIKPKAKLNFNIFLDPSKAPSGQFDSKLIFTFTNANDSIELNITGTIIDSVPEILTVQLSIPDKKVKLGEKFNLPIIIESIQYNNNKINAVTGKLQYNASILAPTVPGDADIIEYGQRTTEFEQKIETQLMPGDTLFSLPMIAALGDAVSTDVVLQNVQFYNLNGIVTAEVSINNGKISISDIFYQDDIPRLVGNISSNYYIYPPPNPVNNDFTLRVIYIGKAKLEIYTVDGILIKDFSAELPVKEDKGSETVLIPRNIFDTFGAYIIRLAGSTEFVSRMIIVK